MNQKRGASYGARPTRSRGFSFPKDDNKVVLDWRTIHPVQLTYGPQSLDCRVVEVDAGCLSRVHTTQDTSILFRQPAKSIVFSVRGREGGFYLKASQRFPDSLIVFSSPVESHWVGGFHKSGSGPLDGARAITTFAGEFGLTPELLQRGFIEVPLARELVEEFFSWHDLDSGGPVDVHRRAMETRTWATRFAELANAARRAGTPLHEHGHRELLATRVALAAQSAPFGSRFSVQDAAAATRSSVRTVQRAFSAVLDTSVSTYVLNLRLERARQQLLKGGATVAAVAIQSGFDHVSRFAEQYRRLFGHRPSEIARVPC